VYRHAACRFVWELGLGSTRILIEIELRRARSKFQSLGFDSLGHKTKFTCPSPTLHSVLYKRSPRIIILQRQFVQIYMFFIQHVSLVRCSNWSQCKQKILYTHIEHRLSYYSRHTDWYTLIPKTGSSVFKFFRRVKWELVYSLLQSNHAAQPNWRPRSSLLSGYARRVPVITVTASPWIRTLLPAASNSRYSIPLRGDAWWHKNGLKKKQSDDLSRKH